MSAPSSPVGVPTVQRCWKLWSPKGVRWRHVCSKDQQSDSVAYPLSMFIFAWKSPDLVRCETVIWAEFVSEIRREFEFNKRFLLDQFNNLRQTGSVLDMHSYIAPWSISWISRTVGPRISLRVVFDRIRRPKCVWETLDTWMERSGRLF